MAPSLGICKLCEKETAKYKCSVCSIPYCSLTCYKPHKELHDQEKASQPPGTNPDATTTSADGSSINTSTAAAGASTSINQDQPPKPIDLKILLNRPALISFIRSNSVLKTQLLSIHNSTLKSTFDAENARIIAQNERSGFNNNSNSNNHNSNSNNRGGRGGMRGGFRGGRQGGGGFNKRPIDWTVERGMNRGLKRIKDLRKGGRQENAEFEEFALEVMRILEEGSAAPSGAAGQVS